MEYYVSEMDGEWFVIFDPVYTGRATSDLVAGPFTTYQDAQKHGDAEVKRVETAWRTTS